MKKILLILLNIILIIIVIMYFDEIKSHIPQNIGENIWKTINS